MAITIDDGELEGRLATLGQQQVIVATKTRMALSVLYAALKACDESGNPEAWLIGLRPTNQAASSTSQDRSSPPPLPAKAD